MGESVTNSDILNALMNVGESIKTELILKIEEENKKLIKKLGDCANDVKLLETRCEKLEKECQILDRAERKNNIILFGTTPPKDYGQLLPFVLELFNTKLELNIVESDINDLFKFKNKEKTIIKLKFVSYLKKSLVLKKCYKLKGTNIFISDDLSFKDREEKKKLTQHMKEAREKSYYAKIKGNKLQINDEHYTLADLEMMDNINSSNEVSDETLVTKGAAKERPPQHRSVPENFTKLTYLEDSLNDFILKTPVVEEKNEKPGATVKTKPDKMKFVASDNVALEQSSCEGKGEIRKKSASEEQTDVHRGTVRTLSSSSDQGIYRITRQRNK